MILTFTCRCWEALTMYLSYNWTKLVSLKIQIFWTLWFLYKATNQWCLTPWYCIPRFISEFRWPSFWPRKIVCCPIKKKSIKFEHFIVCHWEENKNDPGFLFGIVSRLIKSQSSVQLSIPLTFKSFLTNTI